MKNRLLIIVFALLLSSCGNNTKKAEVYLEKAQTSFASDSFNKAKSELDSIRLLYPKEFETIRKGMLMMSHIQLKEQERNMKFCDSMLLVCKAEFESMKKNYILEKDTAYETVGKYVTKFQKFEQNIQRSYIRASVDETGIMSITSIYHGKGKITHDHIKAELKDGTFTETAVVPYDGGTNYSFTDNGAVTEFVTYKNGKDNGVIDFICNNQKEKIKITYLGKKPYIIYLDDQAKQSICELKNLSALLLDIDRLTKERNVAEGKVKYFQNKIEQKQTAGQQK